LSVDVGKEEIELKEKNAVKSDRGGGGGGGESCNVEEHEHLQQRLNQFIKARAHIIRGCLIIIFCGILIIAGLLHIYNSITHDPANQAAAQSLAASEARLKGLFNGFLNLLLGTPVIGAVASDNPPPKIWCGGKEALKRKIVEMNLSMTPETTIRTPTRTETITSRNTKDTTSTQPNQDHIEEWKHSTVDSENLTYLE